MRLWSALALWVAVALLTCVSWSTSVQAATATIPIETFDAETIGAWPSGWMPFDDGGGTPTTADFFIVQPGTANTYNQPFTGVSGRGLYLFRASTATGMIKTVSMSGYPAGSVITIPRAIYNANPDTYWGNADQVKVFFVDTGGSIIGGIPGGITTSEFVCAPLSSCTVPAISVTVPASAVSMKIQFRGTRFFILDSIGPIVITGDGVTGGGGGTPGATTIDWSAFPGDTTVFLNNPLAAPLISEIENIQAIIQNPVCGNGASIVGKISSAVETAGQIASFVGGMFGGGAQVAVLLKILKDGKKAIQAQQQQLCEAVQLNSQIGDVKKLLTDPSAYAKIIFDQAMKDPKTAPLAVQAAAKLDAFPVGSDNLVTAANKTNELLIANTKMTLAGLDRLTGGQREDYETQRGGKLTQAAIKGSGGGGSGPGEPNMRYPEESAGFLGGMFRQEKADGEHGEVVWNRYYDVRAMVDPVSSCLPAAQAPDAAKGETQGSVLEAIAKVRWNARNEFVKSPTGGFLCKMLLHPDRNVTELCFGPDSDINIALSAQSSFTMLPAKQPCIYGPDAPPWLVYLMGTMPTILMLTATIGGIRFFI